MKKVKYLVVGGGVAGTTAAESIRINDSSGSIAIITEETDRLYSRVLLPHYLRDKIPYERLFVRKEEDYEQKNIELINNLRVEKVDPESKKVVLSDEQEIEYERLLLASGGKVNKLTTKGSDLDGVVYLRTNKDAKKIRELMGKAREGVVVGGGFIGIEFAQSFANAKIKTTCLVREPYFWSLVVGENSGKLIGKILESHGVAVKTNVEVEEFVGQGSLSSVKLDSGEELPVSIAGIGVGIHIDLDYLKDSGIVLGQGISTNEFLETETENVWAAGDAAEFKDVVSGKSHKLGNWSNAAAQGQIAGQNMSAGYESNERKTFETVSSYTIPIFDGTFTFLGDPSSKEAELVERGSIEKNQLTRLHIREDRVVGASLINSAKDRSPITNLIKNRVKISSRKEKLADTDFDLSELLNQ